jgi:phosphoglycolate phosphatase-like HAD superfamily hydrolase
MNEVLAVVFDIDGTLITTGGAGAMAWERAFRELFDVEGDIDRWTHPGMTDLEVGRVTFRDVLGRDPTPRDMVRLMHRRLEHLPDAVAESDGYRVLPGVRERLQSLSRDGYLLGLVTGNVEAAAHIKLERGHLNRYFSFGAYATAGANRTEITRTAIERAGAMLGVEVHAPQVVVVGDTPLDVKAGHGAGAPVIGVATGEYDVDALRAAGADAAVPTMESELPLPPA